MIRNPVRYPLLESLAAGLLLGLSFPPFDLAVLQFGALLILFRLMASVPDWRTRALRLLPALLTWNLTATYWLIMATAAGGIAAIIANSLLMLIPLLLIHRILENETETLLSAILSGAVWVAYEFAHHNWQLAWPWLTLGNAWSNLPALIQYISATGHLAISFWVVSSSVMLWSAIRQQERLPFIHAMGVILLFPALSWLTDSQWTERPDGEIEVAVVQPNLDSYLPFGGFAGTDQVIDNLIDLSDSVRTPRTRLIVWPENAIDTAIPARNPYNRRITDSLRSWQSDLITGAGYMDLYEDTDPPSIVRTSSAGQAYNIYNAALHYTPESLNDIYRKSKLVPIVERLPYADRFSRLDIFGMVNWSRITGYGRGTETNNFLIGNYATPALVCYESVFPGWVRSFVADGAGFLTIITNDGWWGDTGGHTQHFSFARLRAIEMRQWVVRSANNGISGIIDPHGNVIRRTGYWTRTAFTHTIRPTRQKSLYAKFGDWFGWLMAAITAWSLWRHRRLRPNGS